MAERIEHGIRIKELSDIQMEEKAERFGYTLIELKEEAKRLGWSPEYLLAHEAKEERISRVFARWKND